jgi:hypothetical protein
VSVSHIILESTHPKAPHDSRQNVVDRPRKLTYCMLCTWNFHILRQEASGAAFITEKNMASMLNLGETRLASLYTFIVFTLLWSYGKTIYACDHCILYGLKCLFIIRRIGYSVLFLWRDWQLVHSRTSGLQSRVSSRDDQLLQELDRYFV